MLKKFFCIFILISIVFTIFSNLIYFTKLSSENHTHNSTEALDTVFIPTDENLFWPTPRLL